MADTKDVVELLDKMYVLQQEQFAFHKAHVEKVDLLNEKNSVFQKRMERRQKIALFFMTVCGLTCLGFLIFSGDLIVWN